MNRVPSLVESYSLDELVEKLFVKRFSENVGDVVLGIDSKRIDILYAYHPFPQEVVSNVDVLGSLMILGVSSRGGGPRCCR